MTGRELLEDTGRAVSAARELRYTKPEVFDDVDTKDLATAARHLRAASYSLTEGAKNLERVVRNRQATHPACLSCGSTTRPCHSVVQRDEE